MDPQVNQMPLPPTTTAQQDAVTLGQRRINMIWESTQAMIALSVTGAVVFCAIKAITSEVLTNAFFLVIGFYYSRTNHSAIGGTGHKPSPPYEGR